MTQGQLAFLSGAASATAAYVTMTRARGTEKLLWGAVAALTGIWAYDAYQKTQAGDVSVQAPVLPGVLP